MEGERRGGLLRGAGLGTALKPAPGALRALGVGFSLRTGRRPGSESRLTALRLPGVAERVLGWTAAGPRGLGPPARAKGVSWAADSALP